jgi:hypothetical protein
MDELHVSILPTNLYLRAYCVRNEPQPGEVPMKEFTGTATLSDGPSHGTLIAIARLCLNSLDSSLERELSIP